MKHKSYRIGPIESFHPTSVRESRAKTESACAKALHADYRPIYFKIRGVSGLLYRTPLSGWCSELVEHDSALCSAKCRCTSTGPHNPLNYDEPRYEDIRRDALNKCVLHLADLALVSADADDDLDTIHNEIRAAAYVCLPVPSDLDAMSIAVECVDRIRWQKRYRTALDAIGDDSAEARNRAHHIASGLGHLIGA